MIYEGDMMNFTESKVDQVGGIILGVFSLLLYFVIIPAEVVDVQKFGVSPRFFPKTMALFLLFLAICLFVSGYRKKRQEKQKIYAINPKELKLIMKSVILFACYIIAFNLFGYMIPTIAALAMFMYMYGQRKTRLLITISVGLPIVIYLFFTKALQMVLP